jgi:glycosyltransferase involved in cell wall biosynthesis
MLWVKANKLLPPHSGGDIRSYNIARCLAMRHELTFLSYYDGDVDLAYEQALQEEFPRAVCVCTGKSARIFNRGLEYVLSLPGDAPYAVRRFASAVVREKIAHWYGRSSFDVVICDFLDAAVNFPRKLTIPSVLFQHNVESEIWRRHAALESNILKRVMYRVEFKKMLRYEKWAVRDFDHVIAVSEHDRELMSGWVDANRISVVPTGVDLQNFHPVAQLASKPLVVFVGAMDWEPNIDAVEYFCDRVWPKIEKGVPCARFRIVGRNPGRRVQKFASDSIEVTGSVPSVQSHLQEAAVVVVPLRIGGGTRLKIYEAMAMGKAVVSTSIGAEGLDVHDGRDIVLADQADAFAQAVTILLQEDQLRGKYERAAINLARQCDWPEIGKKFADVLEAVASTSVKATGIRVPEAVPVADGCGERGR